MKMGKGSFMAPLLSLATLALIMPAVQAADQLVPLADPIGELAAIAPIDATAGFGLTDQAFAAAPAPDQPDPPSQPALPDQADDVDLKPAPDSGSTSAASPYSTGNVLYHGYGGAVFGHDAGEIYLGHIGVAYYFLRYFR